MSCFLKRTRNCFSASLTFGCSFLFSRNRCDNIEIGEEIIEMIEEMKSEDFKKRPSIDKLIEKLIVYCDKKKYSDSIEIVVSLKENKTFVQTPFNNDTFNSLKISLSKIKPLQQVGYRTSTSRIRFYG